ncbi:TPA: hypothetical protein QDB40_000285 [Burkholderia vietnamiensis]|uniref:hypothetical protein n=1 Tax=Burkholderia cepacia TaxID=292 RepID=UPI002656576A|nr:hypothetical protein [Burkholderia cepacia]MDN7858015.1 hypothetical protein [Burkholderia cepacia]HDR9166380.1 hypothetical protein [Burkholderia vietnamiensis]
MDTQQLKLLAGLVRGLLQPMHPSLGHGQSLDLIAALPGLRNWPEVMAFPDRVVAAELDTASTGRLAFRLKKRFAVDMSPQELLEALSPPGAVIARGAPHIWPAGPVAGVYITTSQEAIDALLEVYEDATDGALVYAERAGNRWEGSIDLGEYGLWSSGLDRVPSGTLLIVGPLKLDQQSWSDAGERLEMACNHALNAGHRIAVLLDTPTPESAREDVQLLVRSRPDHTDHDTALIGTVTDHGELEALTPFARSWPRIELVPTIATTDALPSSVVGPLREALAGKTRGLVLLGSGAIADHAAIHLVAASLALTEHAGPAARVMPRHRSTPSKDWDVPEAIRSLPYLPSIESAYAQGYRRIIYTPSYTRANNLLDVSNDALLISGAYGSDLSQVFMASSRYGSAQDEESLLSRIIAMTSTVDIPRADGSGIVSVADLYIAAGHDVGAIKRFREVDEFLTAHRLLRWEDELTRLLDAGAVTPEAVTEAFPRSHGIATFLEEHATNRSSLSA